MLKPMVRDLRDWSSVFDFIAYYPGRLAVTFKSGHVRHYYFVDRGTADTLIAAFSVGHAYNFFVRGKFPSKRIQVGGSK